MERIGVVGCGLMGSGVAEVCARAGLDVVVVERDEEAADAGLVRIGRSVDRALSAHKISDEEHRVSLERIRVTDDFAELADRELVIEAVFEDEDAKVEIFRALDSVVASPDAILASNTSSIPIMKLAVETGRPAPVWGHHF